LTSRPGSWRPSDADLPGRRLFVAVPLPTDARAAIEELVAGLPVPADRRPVRWVRLDGLHVTLRFVGPTLDERLQPLREAVDAVAAGARPFTVTLSGAGTFPPAGRPRALWLGITNGADELGSLASALDRQLTGAGWPSDDRPFRPHLTLARADGVWSGAQTARELIRAAADLVLSFPADRLVLFESHTGGGPARYEPLHEARLSA
jgi:RNA 2',3'-cyclic 3'-phosphodiesterase